MSWHKVTISAHQASQGQHGRLQYEFLKILIKIGGTDDMALLSGSFSHSKTFNIYFTPACTSNPAMKVLIDSCGAVPCDEPTRETESVLCFFGGDDKWTNHTWHPYLPSSQ